MKYKKEVLESLSKEPAIISNEKKIQQKKIATVNFRTILLICYLVYNGLCPISCGTGIL